jgi:hypothetical protein
MENDIEFATPFESMTAFQIAHFSSNCRFGFGATELFASVPPTLSFTNTVRASIPRFNVGRILSLAGLPVIASEVTEGIPESNAAFCHAANQIHDPRIRFGLICYSAAFPNPVCQNVLKYFGRVPALVLSAAPTAEFVFESIVFGTIVSVGSDFRSTLVPTQLMPVLVDSLLLR